jgi:hypothetical protein
MWKSRGYTYLVPCITAVIIAAATACSSSTSPSSSGKTVTPGGAAKGDKIDLTGTYNLASFTTDSSDGNTSTTPADANDGGTLVLTSSALTLTWTGTFATNNGSGQTGTYVATDTSSSVDRGTLTLQVSSNTDNATYQYSTDTLTVAIPQNNNGGTQVTVWIKQ